MKSFQILLIVGGILIIVGAYLAIPPTPFSAAHTANLPSGANYYYELGLSVGKGGHISGGFSELSGRTIVLYVFNSAQYDAYRSGGPVSASMLQTSGGTGTFSVPVLSPGSYYIVLQHDVSTANQAQTVQVSYTIDGMNIVYLGSGLGTLAVGLILVGFGYARKRNVTPPRTVTDVVVFDQSKQESGQSAQVGLTTPPPFAQQPRTKGRLDCPVCGLYFTPELAGSSEWAKIHYREHMTRIHPDYVKLHGRWNHVLASFVFGTIFFSLGVLFYPKTYAPEFALSVVILLVVLALRSMSLGGRRQGLVSSSDDPARRDQSVGRSSACSKRRSAGSSKRAKPKLSLTRND